MDVPSVSGRSEWWIINEKQPGKILLQMINNDRFISFLNETQVQVDHNLFELLLNDEKYFDTAKKYLNSFMFALIKEVNSRVNLGDGATKTEGVDWSNLMLAPAEPVKIKVNISKLFDRKILPVFQEIKQKDRKELDSAILKALGLEPEEYLPKIYEGLCELVKERLELPKMRKKQKTQTVKIAYDQVKKAVIEDILPNGIKQFPEAFYTKGNYDELKFEEHASNGKQLKSESFFNQFELKDETGKTILAVDSEPKAEFAETLSRKEAFQIKIPADEKVIEKILSSYKKYIKQLIKDIEQNAHEKLHDWNIAEKMAKEILDEWG